MLEGFRESEWTEKKHQMENVKEVLVQTAGRISAKM
jgi:hypothetical protein